MYHLVKHLMFVALLTIALSGAAFGQDSFSPSWLVQASGNPDVFKGAVLYQPAPRAQIGLEFGYWDRLDVTVDDVTGVSAGPAWTTEVVARYFALDKQPLNLGLFTVDASAYVGVGLGAEWVEDQRADDIADLRTGLLFGDGPVMLGIEYQYVMADLMWAGAANGEHEVFATVAYRWK